MSGGNWIKKRIKKNPATMTNTLESSHHRAKVARFDCCCGIHGAARERKGIKKHASRQRRILEKDIIQEQLDEMNLIDDS